MGSTEAAVNAGPSYISSHSADVILSDIRPIKLKLEGLRSINVLLDEFLFNILNTARSLSTDNLRASLLSVLPTSLGKEALLEAEVELRAYWDRTARPPVLESDEGTFNLQWAFELLRLKCEAYSTLNETDEDAGAVARLTERMTQAGGTMPPAAALVAPASLYLTAILESMCEHILSNVGRVVARDSSRTSAMVQDVFVALCEDHSIYPLFKSMRVYQQIETLSQTPKPQRNKSFSRSDRPSLSNSRSSHQQDQGSSGRESSMQHRSRSSVDTTTTTGTASGSRSSFDRTRKKLMNGNRSSNEDSANGHKRTDSGLSGTEGPQESPVHETSLQKEFDMLMRSDSTMKVSLTPDRLKTMEVHRQEKGLRGTRRPAPLTVGKEEPALPPSSFAPSSSRANGRRPSLRQVDSIVEDEEEAPRSVPTQPPSSHHPSSSLSSTTTTRGVSSLTTLVSDTAPPLPNMAYSRRTGPMGFDSEPSFPQKTRRIQKNRESLDLDDVMAGSDEENDAPEPAPVPTATRAPVKTSSPTTPRRMNGSPGTVSKSTRDLMDFLNDGPPDVPPPKVSAAGRDMINFLNQGPPESFGGPNGLPPVQQEGKKSSGRLQRMMSRLAMGADKEKKTGDDSGRASTIQRPSQSMPPTTPIRTTGNGLAHQTSYSSLANRPVPPRPPPTQPISPPLSPSDDGYQQYSSSTAGSRSRKSSVNQPRAMPTWEQQIENGQMPPPPTTNGHVYSRPTAVIPISPTAPAAAVAAAAVAAEEQQQAAVAAAAASARVPRQKAVSDASRRVPPKTTITTSLPPPPSPVVQRKPSPSPVATTPASTNAIADEDARDMRRLLSCASNVDECRLLFEMFLAKAGVSGAEGNVPTTGRGFEVPYPSPSLSNDDGHQNKLIPSAADASLELSLVELFLGGGGVFEETKKPEAEAAPTKYTHAPLETYTPVAQVGA
ncbi:unnamed protein product [Mycena citricolor]|uniref:Uncharacterized protein n=1 Tax=Mycena citricolor TaxID=2018698 RepID=A0AAD2GVD8_9AGAR|nr:unnamed protein product [Mycena citricolor]CAK5275242.1 unnamed protein product [Mycena citricolor]